MTTTCAWCQAPREPGPTCPSCGANYAKAEAIKSRGRADAVAEVPLAPVEEFAQSVEMIRAAPFDDGGVVYDPQLELKFCIAAIPTMFFLALAFHASGFGHMLQRMFLAMPIHELGHAVTAWLCGFLAIPTLWFTRIADDRGLVAPLVLLGCVGFMMYRAWLAENRGLLLIGGAVLLLQALGTLGIRGDTAQALVTFGGDGMGMVIATLLIASFFFGKNSQLYKGSLRWGFIAIGSAAFVDMYATWWAAWIDITNIPFGMIEGGTPSDALKLVEEYGWTKQALVRRYFALGMCCMVTVAAVYVWGVRRAWQVAEAAKQRA